jgi:carbon storage regulator
MLVLSRKPGERILIGDQIAVTVVRIAPGIVRIGIDAPENLPIVREELREEGGEQGRRGRAEGGRPQPAGLPQL